VECGLGRNRLDFGGDLSGFYPGSWIIFQDSLPLADRALHCISASSERIMIKFLEALPKDQSINFWWQSGSQSRFGVSDQDRHPGIFLKDSLFFIAIPIQGAVMLKSL